MVGFSYMYKNYPNEVVYFMSRKSFEARNFFHHFYFSLTLLPASKRRVNCIFVNSPSTTPPWLIYTCIKQAQINTAKGKKVCLCVWAAPALRKLRPGGTPKIGGWFLLLLPTYYIAWKSFMRVHKKTLFNWARNHQQFNHYKEKILIIHQNHNF